MRPIVDGLQKQFRYCMQVKRVFFHTETHWSDLIGPIGTPEFALLDKNETILYRWIGLTAKEEFSAILAPRCDK